MASIEEKVESLVSDTINNIGYEVYDVMYVKEGKDNFPHCRDHYRQPAAALCGSAGGLSDAGQPV